MAGGGGTTSPYRGQLLGTDISHSAAPPSLSSIFISRFGTGQVLEMGAQKMRRPPDVPMAEQTKQIGSNCNRPWGVHADKPEIWAGKTYKRTGQGNHLPVDQRH